MPLNSETGKYLIIAGLLIMLAGFAVYFFNGRLHWLGRLPGDIRVERENFRFYLPVTTLIIINLLLYIIMRLWRWLS
ncbi:DUF2905 domain-containing protein [Mucilaginibacter sp. UR6-1]|uniref:DUF2905 domain-containing protein n=1 Tax=Mucilaginibacter sp. UR6-1 TaxID=1435643 RepID=UPI001E4CB9FC|nr:DUF2905 domain-containing protein [Mucilaginibacter sp. UR6-1]MCC8410503.1 DUF2905 domain-containing protein [Mucilaginibacter sp. UR6-1]